jgi:general secretion pathway protein G
MILRPTHARRARREAFTLLEVLIVVAIIVMLAGAGTYYFLQRLEDAKVGMAKTGAQAIASALEQYYANNEEFPASLEALTMQQPKGGAPFFGPDKLLDPWNRPYQYDPNGPNNQGLRPDVWTTHPRTQQMLGNWKQ